MPFLKCKQCDHIDTARKFTVSNRKGSGRYICPRCANENGNIIELGDEVSCEECVYHSWGDRSCTHSENRAGTDFWSRPQLGCYVSRHTHAATSVAHQSCIDSGAVI